MGSLRSSTRPVSWYTNARMKSHLTSFLDGGHAISNNFNQFFLLLVFIRVCVITQSPNDFDEISFLKVFQNMLCHVLPANNGKPLRNIFCPLLFVAFERVHCDTEIRDFFPAWCQAFNRVGS